jgi:hypothetical protein
LALQNQETIAATLIALLDEEIADLQDRGVTGTPFYAAISVARLRLNTVISQANYARTDGTDGLPAIDLVDSAGSPTGARSAFITARIAQIDAEIPFINPALSPWVEERYVFLNRRVHRSRGSLTLLRLALARIVELESEIVLFLNERANIDYILGENLP